MEEKIVTDFFGTPIGRMVKSGERWEVSDFTGRPLGSADENGTRDYFGVPIAQGSHPELLFDPEYNSNL